MVVKEEKNIGKSPQIVKPYRKNRLGLWWPKWQKSKRVKLAIFTKSEPG